MPGRQRGCGGNRPGGMAALRTAGPGAPRSAPAPGCRRRLSPSKIRPPVQKARDEMIAGIRGMLGTAPGDRQRSSTRGGDYCWHAGAIAAGGAVAPPGRNAGCGRVLAEGRRDRSGPQPRSSPARAIARCSTARSRCCADRARPVADDPRREASARRAAALGERVEQHRRLDRARLRRPVDFLGGRPYP